METRPRIRESPSICPFLNNNGDEPPNSKTSEYLSIPKSDGDDAPNRRKSECLFIPGL